MVSWGRSSTQTVCLQENWCSQLQATADTGGTVRADFGARKDSRDLSDWATDLLPHLFYPRQPLFQKQTHGWIFSKTASLPSSHSVSQMWERGAVLLGVRGWEGVAPCLSLCPPPLPHSPPPLTLPALSLSFTVFSIDCLFTPEGSCN